MLSSDKVKQAAAITHKIAVLQERSAKTLQQLSNSLIIRELWPSGVFPIKTAVIDKSQWKNPSCLYRMTDNNGNIKQLDVNDLPETILLSLSCYKQIKHYIKRKY